MERMPPVPHSGEPTLLASHIVRSTAPQLGVGVLPRPLTENYAQLTAASWDRLRTACTANMYALTIRMMQSGLVYKVHACQVDASGSDGSAIFFLLRLGLPDSSPIHLPAGRFHHWQFAVPFPKVTVTNMSRGAGGLGTRPSVRATAQRGWAVFPDGRDVPHPPFHNHHCVYKNLPAQEFLDYGRWATSFGDSACSAADGGHDGHDCLMLQMHPEYCQVLPANPEIDIVVNTQTAPDGSGLQRNLTLFYEVAYRLMRSDSPPRRIGTQGSAATGRADALPVSMFMRSEPGAKFLTVAAPAENSIAARTRRWPAAGRLVGHHRWHSHGHTTGFVFSGEIWPVLRSLGLEGALLHPVSFVEDHSEMQSRVLEAAAKAGLRLLCRFDVRTPSVQEAGRPERYDLAQPDAHCMLGSYLVQKNEAITTLCINHFNHTNGNASNPQHCIWFGNFVPDGGVGLYLPG